MAVQYAPLFALETQFQAKNGRNLTGGFLRVFYAATDDPADTYSDYNLTRNPDRIVLDDNGRALVICDKSKAYRLEVYDADGMLLWTEEPVYCSGTGGGGVSITKLISTNDSISIDESVAGSTTTYDIGLSPSSDEFLEWIKCGEEDCGADWYPVFQDGTMETEAGQGIKVHKGQLYHFTNSFTVDPDGTGINYDTFRVTMYCGDDVVDVRDFDIDSSLSDPVLCEFSRDLIPANDSHVYFKLVIPSTCEVAGEVQCHRVYSGINAVPDTCATKQWVQETFDYNMSSKVDYSAIGYNQYSEITGIGGSAIAGGINSAVVSSIASSYAESAASSKQDISGMSAWIPWSSSSVFQPSGHYQTAGDYAFNSSLSSKVDQSAFDDCCSAMHSALDDKLDKSASGQFAPSGDYAYNSSLSAYYPASASGAFQPSGSYQTAGDYAYNSSLSSKLDASASGSFVSNSTFSSYSSDVDSSITNIENNITSISSDMSAYVPFSGLEGDGMKITGISGSSIKGHEYTGINPVLVDNVNNTISVDHRTLCVDSTLTAYNSGSSAVLGVNVGALDLSSYQKTADMSGYQVTGDYAYNSSVSGKLDATASSMFQPSGDYQTAGDYAFNSALSSYIPVSSSGEFAPSGDYAYNSALTAYQPAGDYAYNSAVSAKLDTTAFSTVSGDFLTSHQSLAGYATESYVDSSVSGKLDATASSQFLTSLPADLAYTSDVASAVSGKLDASASSEFYPATSNPAGYLTAHQSLAGYATEQYVDSAVSGKLDSSAYDSAQFYSTSNPSGFITGVDLTPYQTTADMSAYQTTADMTGYQPSGDYIYVSALGWAEV